MVKQMLSMLQIIAVFAEKCRDENIETDWV